MFELSYLPNPFNKKGRKARDRDLKSVWKLSSHKIKSLSGIFIWIRPAPEIRPQKDKETRWVRPTGPTEGVTHLWCITDMSVNMPVPEKRKKTSLIHTLSKRHVQQNNCQTYTRKKGILSGGSGTIFFNKPSLVVIGGQLSFNKPSISPKEALKKPWVLTGPG